MCKTQQVKLPNVDVNNFSDGSNGGSGNEGSGNSNKENDKPQVLATYRPTEKNTRRMKLGLRSIEGQHGELHVYVVSDLEPKMARVLRFSIKPLSMHSRINGFKNKDNNLPWNLLKFTGNFTIAQAHSWLSFCLPDIPPHYSATSENGDSGRNVRAELYFRNAFVGSHLMCTYEDGECCFHSDSVTTITILKQVITQHATNLNQNVQVSTNINKDSIAHFLRLLHPKLQAQFQLSRQMHLVHSMSELTDFNDELPSYLDPELKHVIAHSKEIKMKFDDSKRILEILYGMVADMYIDVKQQTSGQHSKAQIPILMKLLENYDLDKLIQFFEN
jgi:Bardet-Biedl syndrome 7 protein